MINPNDIAEKTFEKALFGYKPEDVDEYLLGLSKVFADVVAQNQESEAKIIKLVEKINEYRSDEEAIKEALLGAQKQGHKIISDAKAEAEEILNKAREEQEVVSRQSAEECDRIVREHKAKCETLIKENTEKTEYRIKSSKIQSEQEAENLAKLKVEVTRFKAQLTELYNKQLKLIMELPEISEDDVEQINAEKEASEKKLEESIAIIDKAQEIVSQSNAQYNFHYEGNKYTPVEDWHYGDLKFVIYKI